MIRLILKVMLIPAIIILLWIVLSLPKIPAHRLKSECLRVGTKNILFTNRHKADILRDVIREDLDIVLFLEFNGKNIGMESYRKHGYKVVVTHPRLYTHGLLLLAKSDLHISGTVEPLPVRGLCRLPFCIARLIVNGKATVLLGVHLPPPISRCEGSRQLAINYFAALLKKGRLRQDIKMAKKGDPVILFGDFNTISFESALDTLYRAGLEDVYSRHHWQPGPTWSQPRWFPAIFRIDFIFIPFFYKSSGAWPVHINGSDHRGVTADIIIR